MIAASHSEEFRSLRYPFLPPGVLSREQCEAIFQRCVAMAGGDQLTLRISGYTGGETRWARNRVHVSESQSGLSVHIERFKRGQRGSAFINSATDAALRSAMAQTKHAMRFGTRVTRNLLDINDAQRTQHPITHPKLWSDATVTFDGARRSDVVRQLIDSVESADMLSAGRLWIRAGCQAVFGTTGAARYYASTAAEVSIAVGDARGTGAGWAGTNDFDIARIDIAALGERALRKGLASRDAVAIEPGRYTVILEPQAVADLFSLLLSGDTMSRTMAESGQGPFALRRGQSKIGLQVLDPRLTVSADPMDEVGGFLPFDESGTPYQPVTWIERGVLRQLQYEWFNALNYFGTDIGLPLPYSWRMSGGPTSTEEMIATTKRGLLITRLHDVQMTDLESVMCRGYTRDGVWLIQEGKITKPVKNFRFVESPLSAFNRIEQVGAVARVLPRYQRSELAVLAPTLKVRDFNLTQLADAV